jgi:hypothetical protein
MSLPESFDRATLKSWIERQLAALEAGDILMLMTGWHPQFSFVWPALQWAGRDQMQAALAGYLDRQQPVRLHIRQLLLDADHRTAAVEWAGRYANQNDPGYQEILGGTVLEFAEDGLLRYCRTYLDPIRRRTLAHPEAAWPDRGWSPSQNPGPPPTRSFIEQFLHTYAQAWSTHDFSAISRLIHDDICVSPPWDYLVGRENVERGAQVYFAHYRDTQVTPHRFIIDPEQPYFGVCEQTFACTNPETGRRGQDSDFAFFEIAQGKLRYWRTYFDTTNSAQVIEKTDGYLQRQQGV